MIAIYTGIFYQSITPMQLVVFIMYVIIMHVWNGDVSHVGCARSQYITVATRVLQSILIAPYNRSEPSEDGGEAPT